MRYFLILAIILLTASASAEAQKEVPLTEIPVTTVNNRNVIRVPVENYILHMVLDTGATKTSLFQSDELLFNELETLGTSKIIFPALDEIVSGARLAPFDIKFGDLVYRAESPLLIKKRPPIGDRLNFAFDGVLGQDFFSKFVIEVDPDEQVIRLYEPGSSIGNNFPTHIDLHIQGNAPYIHFKSKMPWEKAITEKTMLLDSGYPGVMVFWNEQHFLKAAREKAKDLRASNTGIFVRTSFRLGTLRFRRIPVFIAPTVPRQVHERDGIIGAAVLNSHHHVIDFPAKQLRLKKRLIKMLRVDGAFYVPNNENYILKRYIVPETGIKTTIENESFGGK